MLKKRVRMLLLLPILLLIPFVQSHLYSQSTNIERQEQNSSMNSAELSEPLQNVTKTPQTSEQISLSNQANEETNNAGIYKPYTSSTQPPAAHPTYSFQPQATSTDITLLPEHSYSDTIDFTNPTDLAGIQSIEATGYKTSVLDIKKSTHFDSNTRKVFAITLLKMPVVADGSMNVVFTVKDFRGNTKDINVVVRWTSFKYIITVEKPQIHVWYGSYIQPVIRVENIPTGDNPTVTYTITTDLPLNNGQPITGTFSAATPTLMPTYLLDRSPEKDKEYTYSVRVTAVGMSSYDHTFVIKFVY